MTRCRTLPSFLLLAAMSGWLLLSEASDGTIAGVLVIVADFCPIRRRQLAAELPAVHAAIIEQL